MSAPSLDSAVAKERDDLRALVLKLAAGIKQVRELIDQSDGVTGLHRNGDDADWSDMLRGGYMGEWLCQFSDAEAAIAERDEVTR